MPYRPYDRLVAPARPTAALGYLAFGLVVAWFVETAFLQGFFVLARGVMAPENYAGFVNLLYEADTPMAVLVLLFLAGAIGLGAAVAVTLVHKRQIPGVFGDVPDLLSQFVAVIRFLGGVLAGYLCFGAALGLFELKTGLGLGTWLTVLPLTFGALLIQSGAEEFVFRGYIQSQIAARFSHPAIWLTVPSALFAVLHYQPDTYGSNAPIFVLWAFVFGVAAADLTARTGTLGPAIAMHVLNNFMALGVVAMQGDMSGLSLWMLPYGPADEAAVAGHLPADFVFIAIYWLAARIALRV